MYNVYMAVSRSPPLLNGSTVEVFFARACNSSIFKICDCHLCYSLFVDYMGAVQGATEEVQEEAHHERPRKTPRVGALGGEFAEEARKRL